MKFRNRLPGREEVTEGKGYEGNVWGDRKPLVLNMNQKSSNCALFHILNVPL
jgi:hypothetical protein